MAITKLGFIQNFLMAQIEKKVTGPNEQERAEGSMNLWGKVTNAAGISKEAYLDVSEGYGFTVMASLEVAERIMRDGIKAGSLTPSMAFGGNFVNELAGSKFQLLG